MNDGGQEMPDQFRTEGDARMTTTTRSRKAKAPFRVGDTIRLLHDSDAGPALSDLPVERVTRLLDGRHWRITATRRHATCPTVEVVVDERGRDRDGYVVPETSHHTHAPVTS